MINEAVKVKICVALLHLMGVFIGMPSSAALPVKTENYNYNIENSHAAKENENTYVASNNSVQQLFSVLGGAINKPFITSNEASKKRVSGNFDMTDPQALLNSVAARTGLIWYHDGTSIYVYDASEIQSRVIRLAYAPFDRLLAYLQSSGLYDSRFAARSDGRSGSFYVSGPPVYVELITAAAKYIDMTYSRPGTGKSMVRVIKLKHTFVNDRSIHQRGGSKVIPGVATVLNQLLNKEGASQMASAHVTVDDETQQALTNAAARQKGNFPPLPSFGSPPAKSGDEVTSDYGGNISIVAYSDTNSLLIQGSERQVSFVEDLVSSIDIPKQQIQLSLWILDISKENVDEFGVKWGKNSVGGVVFKSALTPENSLNLLAEVTALAQKGNAQIVSRPEILMQENVPALFDNNSTFYTKLIGKNTTALEKVTWGTMISVLARLASHQQEIEMTLNIEDGSKSRDDNGDKEMVNDLYVVNNTQINTEARVPDGYSLLVGGYSRDQEQNTNSGIPLLKDIPLLGKLFSSSRISTKKMVRLFLIQPKLLANGESWQNQYDSDPVLGRTAGGNEVRLQSTINMLRQRMQLKK